MNKKPLQVGDTFYMSKIIFHSEKGIYVHYRDSSAVVVRTIAGRFGTATGPLRSLNEITDEGGKDYAGTPEEYIWKHAYIVHNEHSTADEVAVALKQHITKDVFRYQENCAKLAKTYQEAADELKHLCLHLLFQMDPKPQLIIAEMVAENEKRISERADRGDGDVSGADLQRHPLY